MSTGIESEFFFNACVAEFRQYRTCDTGLETGPYNFGFGNTRPDWVEHHAYQDGMLVSYWDAPGFQATVSRPASSASASCTRRSRR